MNYFSVKIKGLIVILVMLVVVSCEHTPTDYKSFLDEKEQIYPAAPFGAEALPGNHRLLFQWKRSSDPSISRYVLYWDQNADSVVFPVGGTAQSDDTLQLMVEPLEEGRYNFTVFAYDEQGNRSIPVQIENVRIYGEQYQGGLLNRRIETFDYADGTLSLSWAGSDTTSTGTEVRFTDLLSQPRSLALHPDSSNLVIPDWKQETEIYYRSSYIPQPNAIDTFTVERYDTLRITTL